MKLNQRKIFIYFKRGITLVENYFSRCCQPNVLNFIMPFFIVTQETKYLHTDGSHPRASTTVRNTESFMKIQMTNIRSIITGSTNTNLDEKMYKSFTWDLLSSRCTKKNTRPLLIIVQKQGSNTWLD